MGLMFATRNPTAAETKHIRALLSTFRDGSGNQREADGSTRASWREIERCLAEAVKGPGGEDKQIFDVIAPDDADPNIAYGLSIKSKQLSRKAFLALPTIGRVYMEVANSPAKFWAEVSEAQGHGEQEFGKMMHADSIGDTVLSLVRRWHLEGKQLYEKTHPGKRLDLEHSRYVCVSYSEEINPNERMWQIHSFPLDYVADIAWEYKSKRCLTGSDPAHPEEALFDWYGLSGGQLKYYPRASEAVFSSPTFKLLPPPNSITLTDKAKVYYPDEFPD